MSKKLLKIFILVALALAIPAMSYAADTEASVIKVQGKVDVIDAKGILREQARVGTKLNAGDTIRTAENGVAAVRSKAGDTFVLDAVAAARIRHEKNTFEQLVGKVLYLFTPGLRIERTVKIQTAVIGIRGTTFLLNTESDKAEIGLKEGMLDISSTQDGFNIYQRKEADDFEAYKRRDVEGVKDMQKEFDKYRTQVQEEFIAFKKTLQLNANQSLSISGDKAVISALDEETLTTIRRLQQFISTTDNAAVERQ